MEGEGGGDEGGDLALEQLELVPVPLLPELVDALGEDGVFAGEGGWYIGLVRLGAGLRGRELGSEKQLPIA